MTTGLWPALLAALLGSAGRGGLHDGSGSWSELGLQGGADLLVSLTGPHALYWWMGILCFIVLGELFKVMEFIYPQIPPFLPPSCDVLHCLHCASSYSLYTLLVAISSLLAGTLQAAREARLRENPAFS